MKLCNPYVKYGLICLGFCRVNYLLRTVMYEGLHPAQVGVTPAHGTLDAAVLTAQSWAA